MRLRIGERVPLGDKTTFRVGGRARWFAEPASADELRQAFEFAGDAGARIKILGGGSNLLIADADLDALVIRLSGAGEFAAIRRDAENPLVWHVGASASLAALVAATAECGVSGLEGLAGVPGRVGGAIAMNCGSGGMSVGDFAAAATVFDFSGREAILSAKELNFSYRRGDLSDRVAVSFEFRFPRIESPAAVAERAMRCRERKRASQPLGCASPGCFFKNPPGLAAGALIDAAGCKGMAVGDAEVSPLHANFIVNRGRASCADVVALAERVRDRVFEVHGTRLEPEVVMWGAKSAFGGLRGED